MDEFGLDRPEITGTLLSLEFGPGGRIFQLWASDPTMPESSDEFQFVLGPVSFGEEFSEDYFPGTILLGARMQPDEPWIVSRNSNSELNDSDDDIGVVKFDYEFGLLPEIRASGKFYEIQTPVPQICWDVAISNRGRSSIEIGELAFPFAFYNFFQGAMHDEKTGRNPYQDRVHIHKFIGGSASYLHAVRMNNEPPGLLIFPGDDTQWEMHAHVPRSLNSAFHWEGIPVVYVYSRATIEREGWASHPGEHTSLILEPGDSKVVQTRMISTSPLLGDSVYQTLSACGRPVMRALPGAVVPAEVGIGIEVGGVTPKNFFVNKNAEIESDTDETGGFCYVKPHAPGPVRLTIEGTNGTRSHAHLLFTEPIETLIRKRAAWIIENQYKLPTGASIDHAILPANIRSHELVSDVHSFSTPFAIDASLADTLFLAEKNSIYPDLKQIQVLESIIDNFILDDLQNPADGSVGSVFADFDSVALQYSRAKNYPPVINLFHAMYRIAKRYGCCQTPAENYLDRAIQTTIAFSRVSGSVATGGMPTFRGLIDLRNELAALERNDDASLVHFVLSDRARVAVRQPIQSAEDIIGDFARFEELYWSANLLGETGVERVALDHCAASRDLGPSWWSYSSDYRILQDEEFFPAGTGDKGQLMLGGSTAANSMLFMQSLGDDFEAVDDIRMRMAFGGLMAPWALVRPDGAASMGYCPDPASKHFGANPFTGDIGISLFHYLRAVHSVVLPSRTLGVFTFGCQFEVADQSYKVKPWDGVSQRISLRQIDFDAQLDVGKIVLLQLDIRKRWLKVTIENPTEFQVDSTLMVRGLWGKNLTTNGDTISSESGTFRIPLKLAPKETLELLGKVMV